MPVRAVLGFYFLVEECDTAFPPKKINIRKTKKCLFYEGFIQVFNKICLATHKQER